MNEKHFTSHPLNHEINIGKIHAVVENVNL